MIQTRHFFTSTFKKSAVKLAYTSYNANSSSNKPPIVVMHGLFGSKNNWNSLSKALNQQTGRNVIAIDARNHGDSPHSSVMTYGSMAEDIVALLGDLNYKKSTLIGHSMGGAAVMFTALNYPTIIEKLIVVDMSPIKTSPSLHQMTEIINKMISVDFNGFKSLSEARKKIDKYLAQTITSPSIRQFLLTNILEEKPGVYKWRINLSTIAEHFKTQIADFPSLFSQNNTLNFKGPSLFIGGTESDYLQKQDHDKIKKLFPNAIFKYVEGAGHWVQSENPGEFLKLTTEFIDSDV